MGDIPHFTFSGRNGAYIVWQEQEGVTEAVGTMERCSIEDYSRYGVPRKHKWRVDARALGHTVTTTGPTRFTAMAEWCRLLRNLVHDTMQQKS